MMKLLVSALCLFVASLSYCHGQFLPVSVLNDDVRREQLLGNYDSTVSFSLMPFIPGKINTKIFADSTEFKFTRKLFTGRGEEQNRKWYSFAVLPLTIQQQFSSHHPFSLNDGAMIPSRGYQVLGSGGFFARLGPLSIQVKPELIVAQNSQYQGFPVEYDDATWYTYARRYLNWADLPERFGNKTYSKATWGQSSARLTFGAASFGISNENIWWGPGMRNAILMSNNAAGFKHFTLNTAHPVNIGIGSLEGQIISGRLEASGFLPPQPERLFEGTRINNPKDKDWRYLSAAMLSYHPKWVPGLFLGITRSFYLYSENMGSKLSDYIPLLAPFEKAKTGNAGADDSRMRDQLTSIFARWMFRDAKAEFYFEFGRNDHNVTIRDFTLEPEHSRAYLAGFSKAFSLREGRFIQFKSEITQLAIPDTYLIRDYPNWYVHHQVRDGYTNRGEVLGAGIGPGSSLKTVDIIFGKGFNKIGLQVEGYQHNKDFYNSAFAGSSPQRKWKDLIITAHGDWNYKNLILTAHLQGVQSSNYQWMPGHDVFNFVGKVGMSYYFN